MANDIPTFFDLHYDQELAAKLDHFKARLNIDPPATWIKKNPYANNSQYLPIDKTEGLLDSIFQRWKIEVLREGVMFNSCYVTVRVHYLHPVTKEWEFQDGVGAHNMQTDSGTKLSIETIKDAAVKMALPIAKSEAIKDACDHIGRVFGRDLNRKNQVEWKAAYSPAYVSNNKPKAVDKSDNRLLIMIYNASTLKELEPLEKECVTQEQKDSYNEMYAKLK